MLAKPKIKSVKFGKRSKPHDRDCYCASYPIYVRKFWWPKQVIRTPQTKLWVWLKWELLIIYN